MKRFARIAVAVAMLATVFCFALLSAGCTANGTPPSPTVQLTQAEDTYATSEELLTQALQAGVIPAADKPAIAATVHTARAALQTAQANVAGNPTQFQAAMAQFQAVSAKLIAYRQQFGLTGKVKTP